MSSAAGLRRSHELPPTKGGQIALPAASQGVQDQGVLAALIPRLPVQSPQSLHPLAG